MPSVRKIPVKTRSVAGYFYSVKNKRNIDFESQLEKKFYFMFEFDGEIESYQEQPVKVETILKGRKITYVPDCLICFKPILNKKPLLVEIKYLKEIIEKKEKIANKAKAVSKYSKENGYLFKIFTDKKLNDTYIDNIKFLYRYSERPKLNGRYGEYESRIDSALCSSANSLTVNNILNAAALNEQDKMNILPVIWHMAFTKKLLINLYEPLNNGIAVKLNKEAENDIVFA
jgi:hypothetical protein